MGQRLNIEIQKDGELLANSYFHWSAYTGFAIELTLQILSAYEDIISNNPIQKAVQMLEETGAGIQEDELEELRKRQDTLRQHLQFSKTSNDRNVGFIHVLEVPMLNARDLEEGRVVIDIGADTIHFDVFYNDTVEYMLEEMDFEEEDLPPHINVDQLGCMVGDDWTFDGFMTFVELYDRYPGGFQWTAPDGTDMMAYWISG